MNNFATNNKTPTEKKRLKNTRRRRELNANFRRLTSPQDSSNEIDIRYFSLPRSYDIYIWMFPSPRLGSSRQPISALVCSSSFMDAQK